jgi:hypothetical protein
VTSPSPSRSRRHFLPLLLAALFSISHAFSQSPTPAATPAAAPTPTPAAAEALVDGLLFFASKDATTPLPKEDKVTLDPAIAQSLSLRLAKVFKFPHFHLIGRHTQKVFKEYESWVVPSKDLCLKIGVKLLRDIAGELQMLFLVFPHGNMRCLIEEHVCRLQDGIGKEANAHAFAVLARFIFELRHPVEPADARGAEKQPSKFCMRWHTRLIEQNGPVRVDAACDQRGRHLPRVVRKVFRLVVDSDRVKIGQKVELVAVIFILHPHPVADGAQIIAEMEIACRLDAGNDAHDFYVFLFDET